MHTVLIGQACASPKLVNHPHTICHWQCLGGRDDKHFSHPMLQEFVLQYFSLEWLGFIYISCKCFSIASNTIAMPVFAKILTHTTQCWQRYNLQSCTVKQYVICGVWHQRDQVLGVVQWLFVLLILLGQTQASPTLAGSLMWWTMHNQKQKIEQTQQCTVVYWQSTQHMVDLYTNNNQRYSANHCA